jgi:DNA-binding GntR family transcriptional regulator
MDRAWSDRQRLESVYEAIFEAICEGSLRPGEPLARDRIAEQLQVSRMAVVRALGRLEQQGFLCDDGPRGLRVAPVDGDFVRGLFDVRAALDELATAEVARRVDPTIARRGRELIANGYAAVSSGSESLLATAEREFHYFIYNHACNPLVLQFQLTIWPHMARLIRRFGQQAQGLRETWMFHESIMDAIISGDAESAGALARDHVMTAAQYYLVHIGQPTARAAAVQRH